MLKITLFELLPNKSALLKVSLISLGTSQSTRFMIDIQIQKDARLPALLNIYSSIDCFFIKCNFMYFFANVEKMFHKGKPWLVRF